MSKTAVVHCMVFAAFLGITRAAGAAELAAGPMTGYPAARSAVIWLQTYGDAEARIAFWPEGHSGQRLLSAPFRTEEAHHHTAHITLPDLQPGQRYRYEVLLDGRPTGKPGEFRTQEIWRWRKPAPDFTVLTGSCAYQNDPPFDRPGKPYGGGYEIYDAMTEEKADLMVWLGDNLYYREADVLSPAGMAARYRRDRAFAPLRKFLGSTPQVAIWDDHDYGPNDSDGSFEFKEESLRLFRDYWANPSYGQPDAPGVYTVVHFYDADFFLLDDRWYRDANHAPEGPGKVMFGKVQMDWLKNALLSSTARFKIIAAGGQMLNDGDRFEGWNHYPAERAEFLGWLQATGIKGVLFISGDRHISALLKTERAGAYPLYELTCSPLNSGPAKGQPGNPQRVRGTLVEERNFCTLDFHGQGQTRALRIGVKDTRGKEIWTRELNAGELGY